MSNQTVTAGQTATFTAAASGSPAPTVQWEVAPPGGTTFADISGATSTTLGVTGTTIGQTGDQYEAVFTNVARTTTTTAARLTVNPLATGSLVLHFSGGLTYTNSGSLTLGSFSVSPSGGAPLTVSGNGSIPGVSGGSATATVCVIRIFGFHLRLIHVVDAGAGLNTTALILTPTSLAWAPTG